MVTISATEAKNRFGELLESALQNPVRIAKQGREVAVVLSLERFEQLQAQAGAVQSAPSPVGLLNWIDAQSPSSEPLAEEDYFQHLQDKYT